MLVVGDYVVERRCQFSRVIRCFLKFVLTGPRFSTPLLFPLGRARVSSMCVCVFGVHFEIVFRRLLHRTFCVSNPEISVLALSAMLANLARS